MDFGVLPPEVNSGLMYAGPGSGSMLAAATAWDGLAAVLDSAAVSYRSVLAGLTLESWLGPASASMAAAAAPYAGWLGAAAAQAQQTATQARTAAAAFETALAMTVPPPLIAANRSQLTSLVATNILGQNSPAIEAVQADYAEMWAQDAAAMYGYAAASEAASTLTPFTPPSQTADPAAAQAAAVSAAAGTAAETDAQAALGQVSSIGAQTLQGLASLVSPAQSAPLAQPAAGISIPTPIGDLDVLAAYIAVAATASLALAAVNTTRPWIFSYDHHGHGGAGAGGLEPIEESTIGARTTLVSTPAIAPGAGPASADVGRAALVGSLSVPHSWTMAAPEIKLAVESLPSAGVTGVSTDLGGAPAGLLSGMALASLAGRGVGSGGSPSGSAPEEDEGQPKRKPTVVVIQKPPPATGPAGQ
ncbi:PPE family protein [Mycobacterium lacus]|uniref:PPE family protein n=1 Tax=Mycobacterium lacus TaxID=169765 RepID=UPI000A16A13D|nr:PPE family protein [Mycobacterium lacus]MCV7122329.1 PPE family protein [Mycobacterium lacus]